VPLADAAFFQDAPRPVTQSRFQWNYIPTYDRPDRGEFFIARADGRGIGPNLAGGSIRMSELSIITEAAVGRFSIAVEVPYRELDGFGVGSGWADINIATKSLLCDSEMFLLAFQFKTFIPTGVAGRGLGTNHTSLEPALLMALKISPDSYLQGEIAEWIPLGGDQLSEGSLLHYHLSYNQVLVRFLPDVPLVGTAELNGWSFQAGRFTVANDVQLNANDTSFFTAGGGLRLFVCDKLDLGIAGAFGFGERGPHEFYKLEFRYRY
jgi:hypothetical protein